MMVASHYVVREGYKMTKIGELPLEWKIVKIADMADDSIENSFVDGDWIEAEYITNEGIRVIQTGNIGIGRFIDKSSKKYISKESFNELNCKKIYPGDILICRMADPTGRSCIIPELNYEMVTAVDCTIFRVNKNKFSSVYINYYLNSGYNLKNTQQYEQGTTRKRITRTNLGKLSIPIPPLEEQQKIAEILSTVDEQIENTEQLIEKTKELKKGLMQQLLKKGIAHKEFKQTEFGEIPVSWEVKSIDDIAPVKTGGTPSKSRIEYWQNGTIPWMTSGEVNLKRVTDVKERITELGYNNSNTSIFPCGTVMMALNGQGKTRGTVAILEIETTCNQSLAGILPTEEYDSGYLFYYLENSYEKLRGLTGEGRSGLNLGLIKNFNIALPKIDEQQKIASILSSVDEQIECYEQEKEKYLALKKGLMQQLLTGKIRVTV